MGVAVINLTLGISLAWILTRYTFIGSRIWDWVLILPLSIPSYVLAYTYTYLLKRGGTLEHLWQTLAGPEASFFSPFSFAGAVLVLALNTFPFVYLLARSAFKNFNVSLKKWPDNRSQSRDDVLPGLAAAHPPIVDRSLFLAILYVASDFGAVSLLRFQPLPMPCTSK